MNLSEKITLSTDRMVGYVESRVEGIFYYPHMRDKEFLRLHALVPSSSPIHIGTYWSLYVLAKQSLNIDGSFWECGVFAGGSASFLANVMEGSGKRLHLFDSWEGLPELSERDHIHFKGEFSNCSLAGVKMTVEQGIHGFPVYHKGWMPETFIEDQIAFAHVDVDLYQSVKDCCEYIYPRMSIGGVMVFDDYGHYTCPGAREAVDEYFSNKRSVPLPLITGQAVVFKI